MRHHKKRFQHLTFLLITLFPSLLIALPSDNQALIHVQSQQFEMDYGKGVATYEGKVTATQGTRHLTGNKLTIHKNVNNKIDKITTYGEPATIHLKPKVNEKPVSGNAKSIIFTPLNNELVLLHKAHLQQSGNSFNGEKITYNTQTKLIKSPETKAGRSELILQPIKQKAQKAPNGK